MTKNKYYLAEMYYTKTEKKSEDLATILEYYGVRLIAEINDGSHNQDGVFFIRELTTNDKCNITNVEDPDFMERYLWDICLFYQQDSEDRSDRSDLNYIYDMSEEENDTHHYVILKVAFYKDEDGVYKSDIESGIDYQKNMPGSRKLQAPSLIRAWVDDHKYTNILKPASEYFAGFVNCYPVINEKNIISDNNQKYFMVKSEYSDLMVPASERFNRVLIDQGLDVEEDRLLTGPYSYNVITTDDSKRFLIDTEGDNTEVYRLKKEDLIDENGQITFSDSNLNPGSADQVFLLEGVNEGKLQEIKIRSTSENKQEPNMTDKKDEAQESKNKTVPEDLVSSFKDFLSGLSDNIIALTDRVNDMDKDEANSVTSSLILYDNIERLPSDKSLTDYIVDEVHKKRPSYNKIDILNIAICITQGFLTVFSGEPGCGKTSICDIFATDVLGLDRISKYAEGEYKNKEEAERYVSVSVEEGWTSKRDFVGYYNPLTGSMEPAQSNHNVFDVMRELDAECEDEPNKQSGVEYPCIILLDEANLSPMEYYWSDFMKVGDKFFEKTYPKETLDDENKSSDETSVRPEILSSIYMGKSQSDTNVDFQIPASLRFLATINNDYTTSALSPRLIDRAWVITLPENQETDSVVIDVSNPEIIISLTELKSTFDKYSEADIRKKWDKDPCKVKNIYNGIIEQLKNELNIEISRRCTNAVLRYWAAGIEVFNDNDIIENYSQRLYDDKYNKRYQKIIIDENHQENLSSVIALDYAIAQRLLPHIEGDGDKFGQSILKLKGYCAANHLRHCHEILQRIYDKGEEMKYFKFFS